MKTSLICSLLAALTCSSGCVSPRYSAYTGQDASSLFGTWPTALGSMSEASYAIPVYRGWPERPYVVLGSVRLEDPNAAWDEGDIGAVAREGRRHGGNALIIRQGSEFGVSKVAGAKNDPLVLSSFQTTALVIRWLSDAEIQAQRAEIDALLERYRQNHPDLTVNRDIGELVLIFLRQSDPSLSVNNIGQRFAEIIAQITTREPENFAGRWMSKSVISVTTLLSSGDEQSQLGTAKVSVNGENIAIVSETGRTEMNFSGTLVKGRLTGQIGIGSYSAKAEGAATSDKMSLSFQSLTPDGTIRGNVVLQRITPKRSSNETKTGIPSGVSS